MTDLNTCVICKVDLKGAFGNNPFPVKRDGFCCEYCNITIVIPARVSRAEKARATREHNKQYKEQSKNEWACLGGNYRN